MKRAITRLLGRAGLLPHAFRGYEAARAWRARAGDTRIAGDGLPLPPAQLRVRVAGTGDAAWFLEGGRLGEESIRTALARQHVAPEELRSLLDFGCGCGRVTRRWVDLHGPEVCGSDFDERAIDWCRANLPFARFELNGLEPPLAFDDSRFDLVYALSVFTHLTEELQEAWIGELARVIRAGGLLLLTTHGEPYVETLDPGERQRFRAGELVVRWEEVAGTNLCGAYHPERWVRDRLAREFEVVDFEPEGARGNPRQDLYVLRRLSG